MATAAEIIAALSTVAPDTEMTLPSTCPTPPSSPPSPPNNEESLAGGWVPKKWVQDPRIQEIKRQHHNETAGLFDNSDARRDNQLFRNLCAKMQFKVWYYLYCQYGDIAMQRAPYNVRQALMDQFGSMDNVGYMSM